MPKVEIFVIRASTFFLHSDFDIRHSCPLSSVLYPL